MTIRRTSADRNDNKAESCQIESLETEMYISRISECNINVFETGITMYWAKYLVPTLRDSAGTEKS